MLDSVERCQKPIKNPCSPCRLPINQPKIHRNKVCSAKNTVRWDTKFAATIALQSTGAVPWLIGWGFQPSTWQGSLIFHPFWGGIKQYKIQIYGNFQGFPLLWCIVRVGNFSWPPGHDKILLLPKRWVECGNVDAESKLKSWCVCL